MGLLDLQTNLKNYKFGQAPASDRPGGGNSGQPYIKNPIDNNIIPQSEDFLFRGGLNAPLDAGVDVARLTKFFGDLKSPSGVLFVAKQNTLSRIGVQTQASPTALNEGAYTPLSTLAQAGIGFTGAHVYKQGVNPLKGVTTYLDIVNEVVGDESGEGNRLVDLFNTHEGKFSGSTLYSYSGGPNSSLGVGKTNINFATDNKGGIAKTLSNGPFNESFIFSQTGIRNTDTNRTGLPSYNPFATNRGVTTIFKNKFNSENIDNNLTIEDESVYNRFNIYDNNSTPLTTTQRIYDNGTVTWDQEKIEEQKSLNDSSNPSSQQIQDFRKSLLEGDQKENAKKIMGFAPNYTIDNQKMEGGVGSRVGLASPGQIGDRSDYQKKKGIANYKGVDLINASKIYTGRPKSIEYNDFVKFRIAALNRDGSKTYIHFRAFINSFNDNYGSNWDSISYMGRGEDLYKYSKFTREVSVGFTVAAQSKEELIPQYKRLNYLASTLAPDYGDSGYMGGVITTLTLGGWLYEQPGFITSLSLTPPQESPWEIAIESGEIGSPGDGDSSVKELPHIINVEMSFTPIHQFKPELQSKNGEGSSKFIALARNDYSPNPNSGNLYTGK
jgi:hypothetical protein